MEITPASPSLQTLEAMIEIHPKMVPSDDFQIEQGVDANQAALDISRSQTPSLLLRDCVNPQTSLVAASFIAQRGQAQESWLLLVKEVRGIGRQRLALWVDAMEEAGIDPEMRICHSSRSQQLQMSDLFLEVSKRIKSGVNTIHSIMKELNDPKTWLLCREISWEVPENYGGRRRADLLAFNVKDGRRVIYEIKTSKGDLRKELARPDKSKPAFFVAERFFIVTPTSLEIDPQMLKPQMGLIEVHFEARQTVRSKPAPVQRVSAPQQEVLEGIQRWVSRHGNALQRQQAEQISERYLPEAPSLVKQMEASDGRSS